MIFDAAGGACILGRQHQPVATAIVDDCRANADIGCINCVAHSRKRIIGGVDSQRLRGFRVVQRKSVQAAIIVAILNGQVPLPTVLLVLANPSERIFCCCANCCTSTE